MLRSKLRLGAATLMVAGISLAAAPLAAAAHTGHLFTWAYSETSNAYGIADISTSDATLTQLHPAGLEQYVSGADICNEQAWAVIWGNADNEIPGVAQWNHDTGVIGEKHTITANIADFPGSSDVDSTETWAADSLADCSKLAYVRYDVLKGETTTGPLFVSFVDDVTGLSKPVTELPEIADGLVIDWNGIATDPLSGVTYLFADFNGLAHFATLNVSTGAISTLQPLDGVAEYFESSIGVQEADFQPDGKLWVLVWVDEFDEYQLVSLAPGAALLTATPTEVGDPNQDGVNFYNGDYVLTYDPEALAATGGGVPLGLLVPAGALFLAGLALVAVRRVRSAD